MVRNLKQGGNGYSLSTTHGQTRELDAIDASTRALDFCGQRNPFARRYSTLIKDLQQQLTRVLQTKTSQSSMPRNNSTTQSSTSPADSDSMVESQTFQNLRISTEQNDASTLASSNAYMRRDSHPSVGSLNMNLETWPEQFGAFYLANDESFG